MSTHATSPGSARTRHVPGTPARAVVSVIAALLLALVAVSPALGHAELESSDPAADAVLATPPTTVTLSFSAGLNAAKSSFKVVGPDGNAGTGKAAKDGATTMTADGLVLAPGEYTVEWTSVADDGDLERGTFTFTVSEPTPPPATQAPSPSAAATPGPTASPATSATPAVTPVASAADPGTPAASGGDVLLPILAALVLVSVVGVLVLRRNRAV